MRPAGPGGPPSVAASAAGHVYAGAMGASTREPLPADNRTMCLYIGGGRQPPDKLPPNLICIRARSS